MVGSKDRIRVSVINPGDPIPPPVDLEGVSREGPFSREPMCQCSTYSSM